MNDEMKLRLAYAEIARLKEEMASALDYAFMFSVIESSNMNKLSLGWYIKELDGRLTAKPCSDVEKVAILPCFIQK